MNGTGSELLTRGLRELGLADEPGTESLARYVDEIERWNNRFGLVNASGEDLVVRHILDSLAALETIRGLLGGVDSPEIADVGSGGGLPGVPLACYLPAARVSLVERSGRKCGFLRGAVLAARVRNVHVVQADVAQLDTNYDLIVFRAFSALSDHLLSTLTRLLAPSAAICAYKGRSDRVREEIGSLGEPYRSSFAIETRSISVPFLDEERSLVIIRAAEAL